MVTEITRAATLEAAMAGSSELKKAVQTMDQATFQAWQSWWPAATPGERKVFIDLHSDPGTTSVPMITHGNREQLPGARPRRH